MLDPSTLKFLKDLKKNNNKAWFDAHRSTYEKARENFIELVQALIDGHKRYDRGLTDLPAKDCLFRINRDVRFSKDKSPYKTNFGASISPGGKKSPLAGYYIQLSPGDSFIGGGVWMPEPATLKRIRQEIDYNLKEFEAIVRSKKFRAVYGDLYTREGIQLSKVPQGYEKDNPAAPYLKLKSFL